MAKQRNSLGICVLPVPHERSLTWEEYKAEYGIDLEKIFMVEETDLDYAVVFNPEMTKVIAICKDDDFPLVNAMNIHLYFSYAINRDPNDASNAYINFACGDVNGDYGYYLNIKADKTVEGGQL